MDNILDITFGDRVAENESSQLTSYFIKTEEWQKVREGKADVIFGSKGAGKSALYTLLINEKDLLTQEGITLISADKPVGKTVFAEIKNMPPASELEFATLWKVYLAQVIIQQLVKSGNCKGVAADIKNRLVDAGLMEEAATLKRLINSALNFARQLLNIESVEGNGNLADGSIGGKITFKTPDPKNSKLGFISVDELIENLNTFLEAEHIKCWILFDRLDVAFDEDQDLEKHALRALFKVYRDVDDLESIRLKIFLRDDIWRRITEEGFRESSHITRTTTISWSPQSLLNLIILRAIQNPKIIEKYNVDVKAIQEDHSLQRDLYYKIFPEQVDVGEKQSDTFDWILNRSKDGFGYAAPREVIHFHNEIVVNEKKLRSIGASKFEEPNLFSRPSIKSATHEVSKVKIEQNLFAEYARLKPYILKLDGSKAEHTLSTLEKAWSTTEDSVKEISGELVGIGFFEQNSARDEGIFKIPFLYRPYLRITQGKAA